MAVFDIVAANIHTAMLTVAAYTVILCFAMMKSGALAKSIFIGKHINDLIQTSFLEFYFTKQTTKIRQNA